MNQHTVAQGETPKSIADKYKLKDWKLVYEHPDNAALRATRGANEVKPGDVIFIPAPSEASIQAGGPQTLVATGGKTLKLPPVIFDAHMHVMSGNCTPLPALYQKLKDDGKGIVKEWRFRRTNINRLGKALKTASFLPQIGDFSHRNTLRIGQEAVKLNDSLFVDTWKTYATSMGMGMSSTTVEFPSAFKGSATTKALLKAKDSFVGISIVLTMDMDYCHLDGYQGKPVYGVESGKKGDRIYYYQRESPHERGEKFVTEDDEGDLYEKWDAQLKLTDQAAAENPFRLLPLFHFEPRRYISSRDKNLPFQSVATDAKAGSYIGFKMYTPLGYMPDERHAPVKDILGWFFAQCAAKKIPVMNHCTPSGFYTHDRRFYLDHEPDDGIRKKYMPPEDKLKAANDRIRRAKEMVKGLEGAIFVEPSALNYAYSEVARAHEAKEELLKPGRMRYFYEHFVHPYAWLPVMRRNPELRLCLAHFAGDEKFWKWNTDPAKRLVALKDAQGVSYTYNWLVAMCTMCEKYKNFHTDISYLDLMEGDKWRLLAHILATYPYMRKKIMFGTDWYMITAEPVAYADWFRKTLSGLLLVEDQLKKLGKPMPNLFYQFAIVNPSRFYRLMDVAPKLHEGLKTLQKDLKVKGPALKKLAENFATVMRLKEPLAFIEKTGGVVSDPIDFPPTPVTK